MKPERTRNMHYGIYRVLLFAYPADFRREYGGLMTQAFSDRMTERGVGRTWTLILGDLFISVPQQIGEKSMMNQKLMAALAAVGSAVILATMVIGAGSPIVLVVLGAGIFVALPALISLRASKRSGRSTEFSYGGSRPKTWTWWTVPAALLAASYLVAATGQLISDPKGTNVGALAIAVGFAALIAGGLRLRSKSRTIGNWMVALAAFPALAFFWLIVPAVLALAIIIGSVTEIAQAKPQPA
jgi:hypothetical protein